MRLLASLTVKRKKITCKGNICFKHDDTGVTSQLCLIKSTVAFVHKGVFIIVCVCFVCVFERERKRKRFNHSVMTNQLTLTILQVSRLDPQNSFHLLTHFLLSNHLLMKQLGYIYKLKLTSALLGRNIFYGTKLFWHESCHLNRCKFSANVTQLIPGQNLRCHVTKADRTVNEDGTNN